MEKNQQLRSNLPNNHVLSEVDFVSFTWIEKKVNDPYNHLFVPQRNWKSSHFLSFTTLLIQPPHYYDHIFRAQKWSF